MIAYTYSNVWILIGAERRMDDMLNSETAWNVIAEDDKCKVTECGDKFIILLSTITSRYSALPQPGHRLLSSRNWNFNFGYRIAIEISFTGCSFWTFSSI